jgi:hypothetical protein
MEENQRLAGTSLQEPDSSISQRREPFLRFVWAFRFHSTGVSVLQSQISPRGILANTGILLQA